MAIERRLLKARGEGTARRRAAPVRRPAQMVPWVRMALVILPGVLLAIAFAVVLQNFKFPAAPQFVALAGMTGLGGACLAAVFALHETPTLKRRLQLVYASVVALQIATLGAAASAEKAYEATLPGIPVAINSMELVNGPTSPILRVVLIDQAGRETTVGGQLQVTLATAEGLSWQSSRSITPAAYELLPSGGLTGGRMGLAIVVPANAWPRPLAPGTTLQTRVRLVGASNRVVETTGNLTVPFTTRPQFTPASGLGGG